MPARRNGWIRPLKSGLWAATVRTPGRVPDRITETFDLKTQAEDWAAEQRVQLRRGEWLDPRAGEVTVGEIWTRYGTQRQLEKASLARDGSHWRVHVEKRWGHVAVGAIVKPDVTSWVSAMQRKGVGAATIQGALGVLRSMLEIAVDANLIRVNPARKVNAPERDAHLDRVLAPAEDVALLGAVDAMFPDRHDGRLLFELLLYCGLRWEEAAAVDRAHVDLRQHLINVGRVVERDGTIRPYPKSPAGRRAVPVDEDVWPRLRDRCMALPPAGLVVVSPRGKVLRYSTWHDRVWQPALNGQEGVRGEWSPAAFGGYLDAAMERCGFGTDKVFAAAAGLNPSALSHWRGGRFQPRRAGLDKLAAAIGVQPGELYQLAGLTGRIPGAGLDDPQPTPHDLRHSYGTRLGEQGVPPHEIMALMGHENLESVQRYLHAGEGRHERARKATRAARIG